MRTAAIIENGNVTNVIVIDEGATGDESIQALNAIEITGLEVKIGDKFDGEKFVSVELERDRIAREQFQESRVRRAAVLAKLGLTDDEARDLLGL